MPAFDLWTLLLPALVIAVFAFVFARQRGQWTLSMRLLGGVRVSSGRPHTCPHLGMADDPFTHGAAASEDHRCYLYMQRERIDLAHQKGFCLGPAHIACPWLEIAPEQERPARLAQFPKLAGAVSRSAALAARSVVSTGAGVGRRAAIGTGTAALAVVLRVLSVVTAAGLDIGAAVTAAGRTIHGALTGTGRAVGAAASGAASAGTAAVSGAATTGASALGQAATSSARLAGNTAATSAALARGAATGAGAVAGTTGAAAGGAFSVAAYGALTLVHRAVALTGAGARGLVYLLTATVRHLISALRAGAMAVGNAVPAIASIVATGLRTLGTHFRAKAATLRSPSLPGKGLGEAQAANPMKPLSELAAREGSGASIHLVTAVETLTARARAAEAADDLAAAHAYYVKATRLEPTDKELWLARAATAPSDRKRQFALERAWALDPLAAPAVTEAATPVAEAVPAGAGAGWLLNRGLAELEAGNEEAAYQQFVAATIADASDARAWFWRAKTAQQLPEVADCLQHALANDPDNEGLHSNLEWTLARMEQEGRREGRGQAATVLPAAPAHGARPARPVRSWGLAAWFVLRSVSGFACLALAGFWLLAAFGPLLSSATAGAGWPALSLSLPADWELPGSLQSALPGYRVLAGLPHALAFLALFTGVGLLQGQRWSPPWAAICALATALLAIASQAPASVLTVAVGLAVVGGLGWPAAQFASAGRRSQRLRAVGAHR